VLPPILADFCTYYIILTKSTFMICHQRRKKCVLNPSGLGSLSGFICPSTSKTSCYVTLLDHGPCILFVQVKRLKVGQISMRSKVERRSSMFSLEVSMTMEPPLFSKLCIVVLKSPTKIREVGLVWFSRENMEIQQNFFIFIYERNINI